MSYSKDIDEYTEEHLRAEITYRERQRTNGVCDYCSRTPDTKPCKFPERHNDPRIAAKGISNARWTGHRYHCATCHKPFGSEVCCA